MSDAGLEKTARVAMFTSCQHKIRDLPRSRLLNCSAIMQARALQIASDRHQTTFFTTSDDILHHISVTASIRLQILTGKQFEVVSRLSLSVRGKACAW
jgi:hypothetical protein